MTSSILGGGTSDPARRLRLPALATSAIVGVGLLASGCGGSDPTASTAAATTTEAAATTAIDEPPVPTHLDVATPDQEAAATPPPTKPELTPAEQKLKEIYGHVPGQDSSSDGSGGKIPAASAGSNGSYKPQPSSGGSIDVQTAPGTASGESGGQAILVGRTALAPPDAPDAVKAAITAANQLVGQPYVWGGGHASWYSDGYDCSGSVSYSMGGAGLLEGPMVSSGFENWGAKGPGKWITIYANASHVYAVIAGLRWDTVGDERGTGPRWHAELPYPDGFVVRHPVGY